MSNPTFLSTRRFMGPRWLTEGEGGDVGYSLDLTKDAFVERLRLGLLTHFPQNDPEGTPAVADALSAQGQDRRVIRGINESAESYARRLKGWLDDRETAGNAFSLLQKLSEYAGTGPSFRTVDMRGNWYSRAANGTRTLLSNQGNWDWDDTDASRWGRFWVIFYPTDLWTANTFTWGGTTWGGTAETWGSTAAADEVQTALSIVADWKPAGMKCVNVILALDPASFDPSAPEPDGNWKHWGKTVDGVRVPSRLSTARYWDGV